MTRAECLRKLEEVMELDVGSLQGGEELQALGWDSLKILEFLAFADEQFSLSIAPKDVARCKTVDDLIVLLGSHVAAA